MSEESYPYPSMDEERRAFLDYVIEMYKGQEDDPRFATGSVHIDLPGLPGFAIDRYVYSPGHVHVALAWPQFIARRAEGKAFLDMGCGTGVAAIYVALHGNPASVTATDISPLAVQNCQKNAEHYGLAEPYFRVRKGDVYSGLSTDDRYDIMFWNFPWNAPDEGIEEIMLARGIPVTPERVMQLRAGLDKQYQGLRRFIGEAYKHLNPGGEILLGAGSPSRHDIIYGEAVRHGYAIEVVSEREMVIDTVGNAQHKVILYRLS